MGFLFPITSSNTVSQIISIFLFPNCLISLFLFLSLSFSFLVEPQLFFLLSSMLPAMLFSSLNDIMMEDGDGGWREEHGGLKILMCGPREEKKISM